MYLRARIAVNRVGYTKIRLIAYLLKHFSGQWFFAWWFLSSAIYIALIINVNKGIGNTYYIMYNIHVICVNIVAIYYTGN